ncbi:hypothetical protein OG705_33725 [Streptomyces sp. NBC_00838]|nr:hypothetical protein OG705_33725 [Streptomyces sp. NBC_00838]
MFQNFDLLRQSRLGNVQFLGRPTEMKDARKHQKVFQSPQFHVAHLTGTAHGKSPVVAGP